VSPERLLEEGQKLLQVIDAKKRLKEG